MPIRNQNWYDLQSTRRYPLHDRATGEDSAGVSLPDNIIVDCYLKYPRTFGRVAFIQSVTVSPGIVTLIVATAENEHSVDASPIAAVSVVKPIQLSKNYAVQPLVPGVVGWFVFGEGAEQNFVGRYQNPIQTLLNPGNAQTYATLPITSLKKKGVNSSLTGVINLEVDAPIVIKLGSVVINDSEITALTFSLDRAFADVTYNPLAYYLGPCAQRPESGTCPQTPIETINGVTPDCDGNITFEIEPDTGLLLAAFDGCSGIGIDTDVSLPEVCGPRIYDPPPDPTDQCLVSSSSSSSSSQSSLVPI